MFRPEWGSLSYALSYIRFSDVLFDLRRTFVFKMDSILTVKQLVGHDGSDKIINKKHFKVL
jgi:hypothetical protein